MDTILRKNMKLKLKSNRNYNNLLSPFRFETSDGISRQETAELKDIGTEEKALSVRGSVTWTGPDGQTYTLNYVADENGYQPEGDFLPKA